MHPCWFLHCISEMNHWVMILVSLYESLSDEVTQLKNLGENGISSFLVPFGYYNYGLMPRPRQVYRIKASSMKKLRKWKQRNRRNSISPADPQRWRISSSTNFHGIYHDVCQAPCIYFKHSPLCYQKVWSRMVYKAFPSPSKKRETKPLLIWEAFLTLRVLTLRLNPLKVQVTLIAYQPNLVARQFGLIQALPKCLYDKKGTLPLQHSP